MTLSHRSFSRPASVLVVAILFVTSCAGDTHKRSAGGTFLFPKGEQYTVVILKDDVLQRGFGDGWQRRELYYGYSGGFVDDTEVRTRPEPLGRVGAHPVVLVIAGNRWNRALPVLLYDVGSDEQITITLDMVKPDIALSHPLRKRTTRTQENFLKDGRLTFR